MKKTGNLIINKTQLLIVISLFMLLLISCNYNPSDNTPVLLFSSGFEESVYIDENEYEDLEEYKFIRGLDTTTGYSWPLDILGSNGSSLHLIQENQDELEAAIQTVTGHDGTLTKALYQRENYKAQDDTQLPYEILDITKGKKDLYIKFWIKLDSTSFNEPYSWRTFFEWKSVGYAEGTGFRLISFIYTDKDSNTFWHWQGDANPGDPIWEIDNKEIPVPLDEWFLTEFYWHWSEYYDGRALWKINGEVIGDHYGPSTRNSQPIDFIMLAQLYGNTTPKYQWIDDIEIWSNMP